MADTGSNAATEPSASAASAASAAAAAAPAAAPAAPEAVPETKATGSEPAPAATSAAKPELPDHTAAPAAEASAEPATVEPESAKDEAAPVPTDAAAKSETPGAAASEPETPGAAASEPETPGAAASEPEKPAEKPADKEAPAPIRQLWALAEAHSHPEIWGVTLADPDTHVPSQIVLQKYLNANDGDLAKAKDQLTKTLDWRAKNKPLDSLANTFSKEKFEGLGYVTSYGTGGEDPESKEVFTWNIYGIVKSMDDTFGNLEEFISWRAALMELALQELSIRTATKPITETYDPYKIYQVHDYKSIAFFRQNSAVKTASKETITVFGTVYPELLKEKFFVNVPAIMGFMYGVMKIFVAAKTIKKFHPMSNGGALASEFGQSKVEKLGEQFPAQYGGKGEDLGVQGKTTQLE